MASTAPGRRRKRQRRGKRELTELNWGDGHRGSQHQLDAETALEEEEEWDRDWDDDWQDSDDDWEDWGPPPGLWEEDDLD
jgi:hypothetical protein